MKIKDLKENKKFGIYATVTGGVTGTRSAWARSNGDRIEVGSYEEADQIAKDYMIKSNRPGGPKFTYEPMALIENRTEFKGYYDESGAYYDSKEVYEAHLDDQDSNDDDDGEINEAATPSPSPTPTPASVLPLINKLLAKYNATLHSQFHNKTAKPIVYFNKGLKGTKVKIVFGVGPTGYLKFNNKNIDIYAKPGPAQTKFGNELKHELSKMSLGSVKPIKWGSSNNGPFIVI